MKISNKQLMMLLDIAKATLPIVGGVAYSQEVRLQLVNEIVNQQSTELKDIEDLSN